MATTTTNFGWDIPQSTDLVKDGATAIATLGQDIDTAFVGLKGGTTGQILSKTSNTDLAYTWVNPVTGDITAVTAGTGISGGGTSGDVTITNSMATAIDAKGDLIAGTGADAFSRLAVGTNGQVLTADSTAATGLKWGSAGKVLQVVSNTYSTLTSTSSTTYVDTGLTATITPTSTSSRILISVLINARMTNPGDTLVTSKWNICRSTTQISGDYWWRFFSLATGGNMADPRSMTIIDSPATTSAITYKVQMQINSGNTVEAQYVSQPSVMILTEIGA